MKDNKIKKVLFVATVVKAHINVFHLPYLKWFKDNGFETHVCAKNDFDGEDIIIPECDVYYDIPFERMPFNKQNLEAYRKLKAIIEEHGYDIIHCNTPVASILTRLASRKVRKKGTKVVYTAHGFHFYKGSPLLNWIIYYPIEKICSYLTDVLITINQEDYNFAKKYMHSKQINYVHGVGIDTKKFSNIDIDKIKKRKELGIPKDSIMLLSVGELSSRKNHEAIIKALDKINCKDIHYCIVGRGNLQQYLIELSRDLDLDKNIHLLGFRNDINEICNVSDIFCFPSKQEGLPVALMEAMASGKPIICSNIRGNVDLVKDRHNGYLCNENSVEEFKRAIEILISNKNIQQKMAYNNKNDISRFDIKIVMEEMIKIYKEVLA